MSGAIPDLRLHTITTWRGFFLGAASDVRGFPDLKGRPVIVSGPIGSGRGGGGDMIFKAASRRQGVDPDRALQVEYLPIATGMQRMLAGEAAGIIVPSPGSTGLLVRSGMQPKAGPKSALVGIDIQAIFSGFGAFPPGQLPLGGFHVSDRAMTVPGKRRHLDRVIEAYGDAASKLMTDPERHAPMLAEAYARHMGQLGAGAPPAPLLSRSIRQGDLVYRAAPPTSPVRADMLAWLGQVVGRAIDPDFFAEPA